MLLQTSPLRYYSFKDLLSTKCIMLDYTWICINLCVLGSYRRDFLNVPVGQSCCHHNHLLPSCFQERFSLFGRGFHVTNLVRSNFHLRALHWWNNRSDSGAFCLLWVWQFHQLLQCFQDYLSVGTENIGMLR